MKNNLKFYKNIKKKIKYYKYLKIIKKLFGSLCLSEIISNPLTK